MEHGDPRALLAYIVIVPVLMFLVWKLRNWDFTETKSDEEEDEQ